MRPRDVAFRARELKRQSGLSNAELGKRLGVSASAVSKAVNWRDNPSMQSLRERIIEELAGSTIEGPIYLELRNGEEEA